MNVWIRSGARPADVPGALRFGEVCPVDGGCGKARSLCEIRGARDIESRNAHAAAWYVRAQVWSDPVVLEALAETGKVVLAAIGDTGDGSLDTLRSRIPTASLVLAVDAGGLDLAAVCERLAPLAGGHESFALCSDDGAAILAAAAMGASDLVVRDSSGFDREALLRIARARTHGLRSDGGDGDGASPERQRCLTVRRPLKAGDRISEADMTVAVTDYRGLGPAMQAHVAGLTLRYPVAPGEALHFGHFHDRFSDEF